MSGLWEIIKHNDKRESGIEPKQHRAIYNQLMKFMNCIATCMMSRLRKINK